MAKVFDGMVMIPGAWMDIVLRRNHHNQADLIVIANRKADVAPLLTDRGVSQWQADSWAKELKMRRPPYTWEHLAALFASGLASPENAGVYLWDLDSGRGDRVVRLELDGTLRVIGHFDLGPDRRRIIVPVAETSAEEAAK